jgi:two-component system LytT family response regulator
MSPVRVLIVDDEVLARDTLRLLLDEHDDMSVVGEAEDGDGAIEAIRSQHPDLVFLDIQMPGKSGLEVVEEIGADAMPYVVFATAYDEYALKAFDASAIDYIVKPFSDERFEATLDRVRRLMGQQRSADLEGRLRELLGTTDRPSRFLIKERGSIRFVDVEDIRWVEAAGDYVILHTTHADPLIRETMAGMEDKLDPELFVRIHRSTIVRISAIRELKPYFHGDYMVYLQDGTELKLSRRYWPKVEVRLGS